MREFTQLRGETQEQNRGALRLIRAVREDERLEGFAVVGEGASLHAAIGSAEVKETP